MKQLRAREIKPQIQVTVLWDVSPEEYASAFGISPFTARTYFRILLSRENPCVTRKGRSTARYPSGKLLRMSRECFNAEISKLQRA